MAHASMTQHEPTRVVVGVDTHKDAHVARAKDSLGRLLGEHSVPSTARGSQELLGWAQSHGEVEAFGVEGTGSYGAGLARYLRGEGCTVIEVNRANRQARRRNGKSDPADADAAASAVLSGDARGAPKSGQAQWNLTSPSGSCIGSTCDSTTRIPAASTSSSFVLGSSVSAEDRGSSAPHNVLDSTHLCLAATPGG